jgi:hypothetical protein
MVRRKLEDEESIEVQGFLLVESTNLTAGNQTVSREEASIMSSPLDGPLSITTCSDEVEHRGSADFPRSETNENGEALGDSNCSRRTSGCRSNIDSLINDGNKSRRDCQVSSESQGARLAISDD